MVFQVEMSFAMISGKNVDPKVVVISGVPKTLNPHKMKMDFTRHSSFEIESAKITDEEARVYFRTEEDARSFRLNPPKTVKFGQNVFPITVQPYNFDTETAAVETGEDALSFSPFHFDQSAQQSVIECSKVYNWFELDKLPAAEKGILVQSISQHITPSKIREYFENEKKSHGGPILQVLFMVDGILVLFQDDSVALNVWKFRPHRIDEEPVVVFLKAVPEYYMNRLVVEFEDEGSNEEKFKEYILTNFRGHELKDVRRTPTQLVLATFTKNLKRESLDDIRNRFQTHSSHKACVTLLPKTDCLRVEGVGKLSDAEIITLFENHDRTGGGRVTRLDHVKGNAVLLYFASFQDAESVYAEFGTKNVPVFGNQLKIFRHYHSLYDSHLSVNGQNDLDNLIGRNGWPQASFLHEIPQQTLKSLKQREKYLNILKQELKELATMNCQEEGVQISLLLGLESSKLSSSEIMIVHKCRKIIEKNLRKYDCRVLSDLPEEERKKWQRDEEICLWQSATAGEWVLFGPRSIVEKHLTARDKIIKNMILKPEEFRWIVECDVIEIIRKVYPKVSLDDQTKTLHFCGRDQREIVEGQLRAENRLKGLAKERVSHEEQLITQFLSDPRRYEKIHKKIKNAFGDAVHVILIVEKNQPFLYGEKDHIGEAHHTLKQLLAVESLEFIPVVPDISQKCSKIETLQNDGMIIMDIKNPVVKIAGFCESVRQAKQELEMMFGGNVRLKELFTTEPGKAEYLVKFDEDFKKACRDSLVHWDDSRCEQGKIILTGGRTSLVEVVKALEMLVSKVVCITENFDRPGIGPFLQTREGIDILKTAGSGFNTVALVGPNMTRKKDLKSTAEAPPFIDQETSFVIKSLTITVRKGDITEAKTDAIINSVHPSYDLSKGALSRAVLEKAGSSIQKDVNAESGRNYRVTDGGLLYFKKIFHMIVEDQSKTLVDVLNEANEVWQLASLSLPAIGAGGAKRSAAMVAGNMISAFHDFAKVCPVTDHLKRVDIVIHDPSIFQDFLEASMKLQKDTPDTRLGFPKADEKNSPVANVLPAQSKLLQYQSPITFGPLTVSIRRGNILDEDNDAIVNSVGANFDLSKGMVSREILAREGQSMQNELNIFNFWNNNIKVTKTTKLRCKKVIHVVTGPEMDVSERVVTILEKAEKEKFSSLSIPAIGAGTLGVPLQEVAKLIRDGINDFVQKNSDKIKVLKKVDIVIFDQPQLQNFVAGFYGIKMGPTGSDAHIPNKDGATLYFYSQDRNQAEQAKKRIQTLIRDAYTEEEMKDDLIQYLTTDSLNAVGTVCVEKNVSWKRSSSSPSAITLDGPKVLVSKAKDGITGQLRDYADLASDKTAYSWEYQNADGSWKAVEPAVNLILEELSQKTVTGVVVTIKTCGKTHRVDIAGKKLDDCDLKRVQKDAGKSSDMDTKFKPSDFV